jgi:hypothetical protein
MTQDSQGDIQTNTQSEEPPEPFKLDHLSPSSVKEYNECGLKWYKNRVLKQTPYPSRALIRNVALHNTILEFWLKPKKKPSMVEVVKHYEGLLDAELEHIETATDTFGIGSVKWIGAQVQKFGYSLATILEPLKNVIPYKVEEEVTGEMGGYKTVGRYDWSEEIPDSNELAIWDFKNKPRTVGDSSQTIVYAKLAPESVRRVGIYALKHFKGNIRPHAPIWAEVSGTEIDRTEAIFKQTGKNIEAGVFLPTFKESDCCGWYCPYWRSNAIDYKTGKSIACEYGEMSARSLPTVDRETMPRYDGVQDEETVAEPLYPEDEIDDDNYDDDDDGIF